VLVAAVHQGWVTAIVIVVTIITTIVATQHAQLDVAMMLLHCDQTSVVLVCWLASMPAGSVGATACYSSTGCSCICDETDEDLALHGQKGTLDIPADTHVCRSATREV
jgi:hypothetical protein